MERSVGTVAEGLLLALSPGRSANSVFDLLKTGRRFSNCLQDESWRLVYLPWFIFGHAIGLILE